MKKLTKRKTEQIFLHVRGMQNSTQPAACYILSLWHEERFAQFFVSSIRRFQKLIGLRKITSFLQLWLAIKVARLPSGQGYSQFLDNPPSLRKGLSNFWFASIAERHVWHSSPTDLRGFFAQNLLPRLPNLSKMPLPKIRTLDFGLCTPVYTFRYRSELPFRFFKI